MESRSFLVALEQATAAAVGRRLSADSGTGGPFCVLHSVLPQVSSDPQSEWTWVHHSEVAIQMSGCGHRESESGSSKFDGSKFFDTLPGSCGCVKEAEFHLLSFTLQSFDRGRKLFVVFSALQV